MTNQGATRLSDYRTEVIREGVFAAPPVTVAGFTIAGMQPSDVLILMSILWLTLQVGHWTYLRYKEFRRDDDPS